MRLVLPRLYVILDAALISTPAWECAEALAGAGVRLLQYRNKSGPARELLEVSERLERTLRTRGGTFIVNDRADVAALSNASGVHVGQDDLSVEGARSLVGADRIVGVSTHSLEQFERAAASSADYIAVGPLFPTSTKANLDPVVGTELVEQVRKLTEKPIVAIGGITLECAAAVFAAGADSVAVAGDILASADPAARACQYLEAFGDMRGQVAP
jgi:thiamine-phosphate pyrophosphorylase